MKKSCLLFCALVFSFFGSVQADQLNACSDGTTEYLATAEQLDSAFADLFKDNQENKAIFLFGEQKVGILFRPDGEAFKVGFMSVKDPVVILSNKSIPSDLLTLIASKIPKPYTYSTLCIGRMNDKTIFEAAGFLGE